MVCDERGAAGLLAIVIFSALVVIIGVSLTFGSLNTLESGFNERQGDQTLLAAESCIEEGMVRHDRDALWTSGTVQVGGAVCTISITNAPCTVCTIRAQATLNAFVRTVEAVVDLSGDPAITHWEEVAGGG